MLVALGVSGGIGAYKAVEVARGLQKRGHDVVAIMTHSATRFVGPVTFEAITRHKVITDQWEPGCECRHRAHLARLDDRSAADCAGHRQHHRQVRQRHRRRLSHHAVHGNPRAGADGSGDEHADVLARGRPSRIWTRSSGMASASSSRARGTWRAAGSAKDGWPSPTRSAPRPTSMLRPSTSLAGRRVIVTAGPDLRGHRSGSLSSAIAPAAAWDSRSPTRRRGGALW